MGIFTRFRDIVGSNINAMLDRAEDPEKLIKMMIREMEDTLVELKAACASLIADHKKMQRRHDDVLARETLWADRAGLAVAKGRDNLAREALVEKKRFSRMAQALDHELVQHSGLLSQYRDDIDQLEDKLNKAKEKQHILTQRGLRAQRAKKAQQEIRRMDNYETIAKFEELENRIDQMEAEAELINPVGRTGLDRAFEELHIDDDIEQELKELKFAHRSTVTPS